MKKLPADAERTYSNLEVLRSDMSTENTKAPNKPINMDLTMK